MNISVQRPIFREKFEATTRIEISMVSFPIIYEEYIIELWGRPMFQQSSAEMMMMKLCVMLCSSGVK